MLALDICEPDEFDSTVPNTPSTPVQTPTNTAKTDKPLTSADGQASDIQINQLKDVLKKLREKDKSQEGFIEKIAIETKGFTEISRVQCEKITMAVSEMLKDGE